MIVWYNLKKEENIKINNNNKEIANVEITKSI